MGTELYGVGEGDGEASKKQYFQQRTAPHERGSIIFNP